MTELSGYLKIFRRRYLQTRLVSRMFKNLLFCLMAASAFAMLDKWIFLPASPLIILGWCFGGSTVLAAFFLWFKMPPLLHVARLIDLQQGTKECLSAAQELDPAHAWQPAAYQAAMSRMTLLSTAEVFPFLSPPGWKQHAAWLTLFIALHLIPRGHSWVPKESELVRNAIHQEGARLASLAKQLNFNDLKHTAYVLEHQNLSKREALEALEKLNSKFRDDLAKYPLSPLEPWKIKQASDILQRDPSTKPLGEALASGDLNKTAQALDQLQKDLPRSPRQDATRRALNQAGHALKDTSLEQAGASLEQASGLEKTAQLFRQAAKASREKSDLAQAASSIEGSKQAIGQTGLSATASSMTTIKAQHMTVLTAQATLQEGDASSSGETSSLSVQSLTILQVQGSGSGSSTPGMNLSLTSLTIIATSGSGSSQGQGLPGGGGKGGQGWGVGSANIRVPPRHLNGQYTDIKLSGQIRGELNPKDDAHAKTVPRPGTEPSSVPYQSVYQNYRDFADQAVTQEKIPKTHRNLIKAYFESLQPREGPTP